MNKVLFVSNKYPFPSDDGKKTVLAGFLLYLVERFGAGNVVYVVIGRRHRADSDPRCAAIWIDPPGRMAQMWNFARGYLRGEKSIQESLTYSPKIERLLHALCEEMRPDVLLFDTLRTGQFFWDKATGQALRVLYMDDLFYLRFQRMLKLSQEEPEIRIDPMGTFSSFLPAVARAFLRIGSLKNMLYGLEMARIEQRELASGSRFDCCLLINPNEVNALKGRCPGARIFAVKPLLYSKACAKARAFNGAPSFLMFGSLRHPVYRASVIRFLELSMAKVLARIPNAQIKLIGDGADEQIKRLGEQFRGNVELHGFVPDISALFAESCALLVPLVAPGGLKLKMLTALYYGLPIIATDSGVDGIPLQEGVDFIKENKVTRFPLHMERLLNVDYNAEISRNAARAFERNYSKDKIFAEYDSLFCLRAAPDGDSASSPSSASSS